MHNSYSIIAGPEPAEPSPDLTSVVQVVPIFERTGIMNGSSSKIPVRFEGENAHRRAFLRAAAVATGGALIVGRGAAADDPPKEPGHSASAKSHGKEQAPPKEAFEGLLVTPSESATSLERKNIAYLPDAERESLREAFRALGSGVSPGSIYSSWINLHAGNCQHNNSLIWPWHRAYLYYFELRLQRALPSASPPVTIPYWAYDTFGTEQSTREFRKLPEPYRARNVGGRPNPLFVERPAGQNAGNYILAFSGTRTSGIINNSSDYFQFGTNLENQPHNFVHNNPSGAIMNDRLYSPTDPVFWLHHSNLDRAWLRWTQVPGHQNPQENQSPAIDRWLNTTLPGFEQFPKRLVREFLELGPLGYTYVMQTMEFSTAASKATKTTSSDLDFSAAVLPERERLAAQAPAIRPVLIRFRDVSLPRSTVLEVRVFLNRPDANAETSLDDPSCVGVFTLYPPHAEHGSADERLTIDLDATDTVRRLIAGEKGRTKFPLTTVVVPSRQAAAEAAAEPLRFKSAGVIVLDVDRP
jgi:tyrosinase